MELHNSYRSSSKSFGVSAGATVGYGHKLQITGNGGSISAGRSNLNTDETIHHNGSFTNVDEVHNNTGTMTLSGFNQEGGKVTGNIGKVEVISRQNTSTTTGSSKGVNLGISANGVPSSVTINTSRTNGNRAFVDNQSSFIVGEGSNLHIRTVENTGAIIGKEGNSTFKIDSYVGKDIHNHDTMTTTGGSIGASLEGKPKITNVGFNQDSRDKQGITRNTVIGNPEIGRAEGAPINTDISKANETTKNEHRKTDINIESQTIRAITNPGEYRKEIEKAKQEIKDIYDAVNESINDRGDDNRNFLGQLSERRLATTINNIGKERFKKADTVGEITDVFKSVYKDLGYDVDIIYSDPEHAPQLIGKDGKARAGRAYVDEKGRKTIIINMESAENWTKSGLIGTISEEGSHVIGKIEGRQRKTGTEEKGLESTGKATNEYFKEQYRDNDKPITPIIDGKNYTGIDFGEHVGDDRGSCMDGKKTNIGCKGRKQKTWSELTPEEKSVEGEIVSTILNFVPYVGPAKIATEAIIGKDLITNKKMSYLDRVSSVSLLSKFHLGELNPKKIGTKKTKEPHKEKPLRRKEKVGNDRNSVKAKTSENKSPKDIELVEGKDGIFEVPKNEGKKKSDTSVSKSNPVTKKEPMRDVTPKVKEPSTKETPKSSAVKPIAKPEQNIETVKQPAVTSEKSKLENGSSEKNLDTKKELTVYNPDFANVQKGDYLNTVRIVNKDGSSNIPKGQGIFKVDNRPYLRGSRPSFKKDFEQNLYDYYNGIMQDSNTKEILDWKPGQPRKVIVDFGHTPGEKYSNVFEKYKNELRTPKQFRDWYNDVSNYQFENPSNNRSHKYE